MSIAEEVARMPAHLRETMLRDMPGHLDAADQDPAASTRLLSLARRGFVRQKIDYTYDVAGADRDFLLFFRACLRLNDLPGALRLARDRAGVAGLNDWLTSDALAPLLQRLDPGSAFAAKILGALESVEPIQQRAARLTNFVRPGLPVVLYRRLRAEFSRHSAQVGQQERNNFLAAAARSGHATIDDVLAGARTDGVSSELARETIAHLGPLCQNHRCRERQAAAELGRLAADDVEAFTTAVDTAARQPDTDQAVPVLEALSEAIPAVERGRFGVLGCVALAQAFTRHDQADRAEALLRSSLTQIPPPSTDFMQAMFDEKRNVRTGVRLIQAAAPFPHLWERAVAAGRELTARARGRGHAAEVLAGMLHATPEIPDPERRIAWLTSILTEIRGFTPQDDQDEDERWNTRDDTTSRLLAAMRRTTAKKVIIEPLNGALRDPYADADRILADPDDLEPLDDLTNTAVALWSETHDSDGQALAFFRYILPAVARSCSPSAILYMFGTFTGVVIELPQTINEALEIMEETIAAVITSQPASRAARLLDVWYEKIEAGWAVHQPDLAPVLASSLLRQLQGAHAAHLLQALNGRIGHLYDTTQPSVQPVLWAQWAEARIALGEVATGRAMLTDLLDNQEQKAESTRHRSALRILAARALVAAGDEERAADLLRDAVGEPDLSDGAGLKDSIDMAGLLLRTSERERGRNYLLAAARGYRQSVESLPSDVVQTFVEGFAWLNDDILVGELLALAEAELLDTPYPDSSYAARWYALLALAVCGEQQAAEALMTAPSEWTAERQRSILQGKLVRLACAAQAGERWQELLAELGAQLAGIEDARLHQTTLDLAARLLALDAPGLRASLTDMLLDRIDSLVNQPGEMDAALRAVTDQLGLHNDVPMLERVAAHIGRLVGQIPRRHASDPRYYLGGLLGHLLRVARQLPGGEPLAAALTTVIQRSTDLSNGSAMGSLLAESCGQADQRLPHRQRALILQLALARLTGISDHHTRVGTWATFAEALARQPDLPGANRMAARLNRKLANDPAPRDQRLVAQAKVYRSWVQGTIPKASQKLARCVRADGRPDGAGAQVAWASALLPTPLHQLAEPLVEELYTALDRLTASSRDFEALRELLEAGAVAGPQAAARRILAVADWAATMPLVTNKDDWRDRAYLNIIEATLRLAPPQRMWVQRRVLERAHAALPQDLWTSLCGDLLRVEMEAEVTETMLARDLEISDSDTEGARRAAERLENLLTKSPSVMPTPTASVLCLLLDRYGLPLQLHHREAVARIASTCRHRGLERRLSAALIRSYESQGAEGLTDSELDFLARMPHSWWVDRITTASAEYPVKGFLTRWVEHCAHQSSAAAQVAVVLSAAWLSCDAPDDLDAHWLEVATSPSPIDPGLRSAVLKMLAEPVAMLYGSIPKQGIRPAPYQ